MKHIHAGNKQFYNDYAKITNWLDAYLVNGETIKDPKWYSTKNVGLFNLYNALIDLKRVQYKIEQIKKYYSSNEHLMSRN